MIISRELVIHLRLVWLTTNISRSTYNSDEGIQKSNDFTVDIPASTAEKAGVQTAADKKLFNSIPQTV